MSNPVNWRDKGRTETPNSRQKRNKFYIDAHPWCQRCDKRPSAEAHHERPKGDPARYAWENMKALCVPCHIAVHRPLRIILTVRQRGM